MIVTKENYGLMPVLSDENFMDDVHFSFNLDNKPNFWILSDIFPIDFYFRTGFLSFGDILIFIGVFAAISAYINYYFKYKRYYA